jgi:MFS transporter, DHA2 family, triacylglyceride efflux pump
MVRLFSRYSQQFSDLLNSLHLDWAPPDWRTLFWINLPVSLLALVLTWWALRDVPQERGTGRFDFLGTILIVGALIGLVVGLGANIEISSSTTQFSDIGGLPPYAVPVLSAAAIMFLLFILVEVRSRDPLFDLRIFRRRSLSAGLATNLFVGFCLMIGLVSVPILVNVRVPDASYLSEAALQVGLLLSALTVPMAIAAVPGGWLVERIGYRWTTLLGLGLALIGFASIWQTWTLDVANNVIAVEMALVGIGLGLTFSPISASVINAADRDKLGVASALVIIMRLLGMTISVSALTAFASQRLATLAAAELGPNVIDPYAAMDVYAKLTAKVLAELGLLGALICAVALIPALWLRRESAAESVVQPGD